MTSLLRFRKEARRRRREHRDGADGASGAELRVDNCEYVRVEGASTLLRVQVGSPGGDLELRDLTLVSRGDAGEGRHDLLAPPTLIDSAGDETWQLVFALPVEIVEDGDTRFELSRGDRVVVRLGRVPDREALGDMQARLDRERSGRLRAEELLADRSQDLADARALVEQLERRATVGERNLAELRQKLLLSWTESSELRQLLESREEAHEKAKQEARTLRDKDRELRALLADQEHQLSAAQENVQRRCE